MSPRADGTEGQVLRWGLTPRTTGEDTLTKGERGRPTLLGDPLAIGHRMVTNVYQTTQFRRFPLPCTAAHAVLAHPRSGQRWCLVVE